MYWKTREPKVWHKRFAILPQKDDLGRSCWLEWYWWRYTGLYYTDGIDYWPSKEISLEEVR